MQPDTETGAHQHSLTRRDTWLWVRERMIWEEELICCGHRFVGEQMLLIRGLKLGAVSRPCHRACSRGGDVCDEDSLSCSASHKDDERHTVDGNPVRERDLRLLLLL